LEEEGLVAFSSKVDQTSVNGLEHADSAIKETLRLHTAIKALSVQVMQPAGLNLKGFNIHLPQGSRVSLSVWGIHHDEDIYPAAYTYDAFRFVQNKDGGNKDSLVSPSENYLSFGLGKHSCPGRNFAAVATKLFLAYLAVHYDVEAVHERPIFISLGHLPIPPVRGRLRIRRKIDPR
jgi:cytochrome P450